MSGWTDFHSERHGITFRSGGRAAIGGAFAAVTAAGVLAPMIGLDFTLVPSVIAMTVGGLLGIALALCH